MLVRNSRVYWLYHITFSADGVFLSRIKNKFTITLENLERQLIISEKMTYNISFDLVIRIHFKHLLLLITFLGHYFIIFGILWMQKNNLFVKFSTKSSTLNCLFCNKLCPSLQALRFSTVEISI